MKAFALIEQNFLKGQGKILGFYAKLSSSVVIHLFSEFLDKSRKCDRICHCSVLWENREKSFAGRHTLLGPSFMIKSQCNFPKPFENKVLAADLQRRAQTRQDFCFGRTEPRKAPSVFVRVSLWQKNSQPQQLNMETATSECFIRVPWVKRRALVLVLAT
jgi:hypothetical protein